MTAGSYRRVLAAAAVMVFFTNFSVYVSVGNIAAISPWHIILFFAVAAMPLLVSGEYVATLRRMPAVQWCYGFVLVSAVWLLIQGTPSDAAWQEFRTRILSSSFLLLLLCLFSDYQAQLWARRAVFASVLMAVGLNLYEVFNPLSFSEVLGRSAGLYVNSNQSGGALILGMLFSVALLPQRYRLLFALTVGVGVFVTFSRGAIAGWFIAVAAITATGVISLRRSLVVGSFALAVTAVVLMWQWDSLRYQLEDSGILNRDVSERIAGLAGFGSSGSDESAVVRREVATGAFEMFADQPLLGHGLAAWQRRYQVSSHNQYLSLMVDHGILGFFLFPLLVLAVLWRAQGEARKTGLAFAIFILFWGGFSHTILEENDVLIMFSLLAAMTASSRFDERRDQQAVVTLHLSRLVVSHVDLDELGVQPVRASLRGRPS